MKKAVTVVVVVLTFRAFASAQSNSSGQAPAPAPPYGITNAAELGQALAAGKPTQATTNETGGTMPRYTPGWMVELRTAALRDGKFALDPGTGSTHLELGPSFTEENFVKRSGLSTRMGDLRYPPQPAIAGASSKFVVRRDGVYRLGVRVEIPAGITTEFIANGGYPPTDQVCWAKLKLNDEVLVDDNIKGKWEAATDVVLEKPVELSSGLYDTTADLGCYFLLLKGHHYIAVVMRSGHMMPLVPQSSPAVMDDTKLAQTMNGKMTILVAHPGALAGAPAESGEFVVPDVVIREAPPPVKQGDVPALQPNAPLPAGFGTGHL